VHPEGGGGMLANSQHILELSREMLLCAALLKKTLFHAESIVRKYKMEYAESLSKVNCNMVEIR